jgi:hypothetical protein
MSDTWSHPRAWSRRGRRTGRMITRVFRELGRPCRLHRDCRLEPRLTNSRLIPSLRPRLVGTKNGTKRWYRPAKETKRGEMDDKESQRPIVVSKRGNGPSRTPWSEGGAGLWTRSQNRAEGIEPPRVSPQSEWIVRGTANPQRDEPDASLTGTSGSVGVPGSNPWDDPAYLRQVCPADPCWL